MTLKDDYEEELEISCVLGKVSIMKLLRVPVGLESNQGNVLPNIIRWSKCALPNVRLCDRNVSSHVCPLHHTNKLQAWLCIH